MSDDGFNNHQRAAMSAAIRDLLKHDKDGDITGAVLAELLAHWISNHSPRVRAEVRAEWDKLVNALIPAFDEARTRPWPKPN